MVGKLPGIERNADGQALHDLDPVSGCVLGWYDGECGARSAGEADDLASILHLAAVEVGCERHRLPGADLCQLHFLEIGVDIGALDRDNHHQRLPWLDPLADLDLTTGYDAIDRRPQHRSLEIDLGLITHR